MIDGAHAVRWGMRELRRDGNDMQYTRWHWTTDANFTLCGRPIRMAIEGGTFFPETDDLPETVNCVVCKKRMDAPAAENGEKP